MLKKYLLAKIHEKNGDFFSTKEMISNQKGEILTSDFYLDMLKVNK